jgi:hypothetical protein
MDVDEARRERETVTRYAFEGVLVGKVAYEDDAIVKRCNICNERRPPASIEYACSLEDEIQHGRLVAC